MIKLATNSSPLLVPYAKNHFMLYNCQNNINIKNTYLGYFVHTTNCENMV